MVVNVEEIKPQGLELTEAMPQSLLEAALVEGGRDTGFRAEGGFSLAARLEKVGRGVLLTGRLAAPLLAPCKRCLADVHLKLPVEFTLNLVPTADEGEGAGEGDDDESAARAGSFDLGDADEEPFDGKTIDLDPIVREQVLLALPISVVCRDECKGLCPVCGQNLNERECGCERKALDPRLAALKDIKLN